VTDAIQSDIDALQPHLGPGPGLELNVGLDIGPESEPEAAEGSGSGTEYASSDGEYIA
jgi:hypothetical protein